MADVIRDNIGLVPPTLEVAWHWLRIGQNPVFPAKWKMDHWEVWAAYCDRWEAQRRGYQYVAPCPEPKHATSTCDSRTATTEPWAIWWTTQADAARALALVENAKAVLPTYVAEELCSRIGRDGRGRLWAAKSFGSVGVAALDWDDAMPICIMASTAGGIVLRTEDVPLVSSFPGFITTSRMKIWGQP